MNITIGMIVLNEEEYLEKNLKQHYEHADRIVIVEGADRNYPAHSVTDDGLSTDKTRQIIQDFPDPDRKIKYVPYGWTKSNTEQAKCELRNAYLEHTPRGLLIAVDADEFYKHEDLEEMIIKARSSPNIYAWLYPQIHLWKTHDQFITGGYYDVPHIRFWQIQPGDQYTVNHNHPYRRNRSLRTFGISAVYRQIVQKDEGYEFSGPVCYHFGFCKKAENISDKNTYYTNRGESSTRPGTTKDRAAWFADTVDGLLIHKYSGTLPEVFTSAVPSQP